MSLKCHTHSRCDCHQIVIVVVFIWVLSASSSPPLLDCQSLPCVLFISVFHNYDNHHDYDHDADDDGDDGDGDDDYNGKPNVDNCGGIGEAVKDASEKPINVYVEIQLIAQHRKRKFLEKTNLGCSHLFLSPHSLRHRSM